MNKIPREKGEKIQRHAQILRTLGARPHNSEKQVEFDVLALRHCFASGWVGIQKWYSPAFSALI